VPGPSAAAYRPYDSALAVFALFLVTGAVNLEMPLYRAYASQAEYGNGMTTLMFASYIAGLLPSLLFFGGLSDRLGRPTLGASYGLPPRAVHGRGTPAPRLRFAALWGMDLGGLAELSLRGGGHRARAISGYFVLAYLGFGVPSVGLGFLSDRFGLMPTLSGFGILLSALCAWQAVWARSRPRAAP
jgi:hypothetical protein